MDTPKSTKTQYANSLSETQIRAEWAEVERAKQNPALFRPLYQRHYNAIFRFIYQRILEEETTADLTAQVFLKTMQNLQRYHCKEPDPVPFSALLYQIATNEVNYYYRQTNKRRVIALEDYHVEKLEDEINDDNYDVNLAAVKNFMQQLSPKEVMLLQLRYFQRPPMQFKEIATVMEIEENAAKTRSSRLIEKLRRALGGQNNG